VAKKSMIARERKRERLAEKHYAKRAELKAALADPDLDQETRMILHGQLQRLPRNSSPTRMRTRCWLTGRPRAVYSDFGLCRNAIRRMAHEGLLPGVVKSSW
jgi:small subunit ribosomal protein S14